MKIFFSRRHSPTNVTLRFVNIQNHSCLYSKGRTDLSEAFGDVFMYRRLTNPILFCRLTHRCIVVYDISCNFHCPFLDITFHSNPRIVCFFYNLCGEILMYVYIENFLHHTSSILSIQIHNTKFYLRPLVSFFSCDHIP